MPAASLDSRSLRPLWRAVACAFATAAALALPRAALAQDPAPDEEPRVGYGESGFFAESEDGDYRLQIGGQLQPRFDFSREQADAAGEDDETSGVFLLRRARTELSGHVFDPGIKFVFQVDWARGFPALKDAFIDFVVDKQWFAVRVGQFKVPTSRQHLASSKRLELVDRALATTAFRDDRDLGLALHNGTRGVFEYHLGMFNGTSDRSRFRGSVELDAETLSGDVADGRFTNVPETFRPLFAARLGVNVGGIDGYAEGDLEGATGKAEGFRFAAATSGYTELDVDENDTVESGVEGDVVMKIAGFALNAMAFYQVEELEDASEELIGGLAQASFAIPTGAVVLQPALRYSAVAALEDGPASHEAGGGVGVYFYGHRLKLQVDGYALVDEAESDDEDATIDALVRAQVQLLF